MSFHRRFNPLSANVTKWPNTLKQFVGNLPTNCLNVSGHLVGLALKGLNKKKKITIISVNSVLYIKRVYAFVNNILWVNTQEVDF